MDETRNMKLKPINDDDYELWSFYEDPDCDPSCWEIEECVDWDALDEMLFGDL